MLKLAVVGADVAQSCSPSVHSFIADCLGKKISYERVSVGQENFDKEIEKILANFDGINVTAPYKIKVLESLKNIYGAAAECGSVNTVLCGERSGYSTDGAGFMQSLSFAGFSAAGKRVLLLGAGGAARCVACSLSKANAQVFVYSRTYERVEELSRMFSDVTPLQKICGEFDAVVNATGVGSGRTEGMSPIDKNYFFGARFAVDLIYKPRKTEFLRLAESCGAKILNGFPMLFFQAYYSDCLYFGINPSSAQADELYKRYIEKTEL